MGLLPISWYYTGTTVERCLKDQSYYGAISWHNSFRTMGRIASGPAALETLRPERSLLTPAVEILTSCIIENLHCRRSGNRLIREVAPFNIVVRKSFIRSRGALMEKTD